MDYKSFIRDIPDYPKKGIVFKDITTLLKDATALTAVVTDLKAHYQNQGITKICGIESRGFIFGAPLAYALGVGFVPVRKQGKLPWTTYSQEYTLEYGTDKLEIHIDAVEKGEKVLVVDDLLATGGTAKATLQRVGAHVAGLAFLTELTFLPGRQVLQGYEIFSLVKY